MGYNITCTMSGQPQPTSIPFPALGHVIHLSPGDTQQIIWALAAFPAHQKEVALHALDTTIGCPWEAEISRIELTNTHDQVDIITGDPKWDHVFAMPRCLLPFWARISTPTQAQAITVKTIKRRFLKNYGICISPQTRATRTVPPWRNISLPWNQLIGEALLANNQQALVAELVTRIMRAIIQNLKHSGCFFEFIDGQTGQGIGERNHLRGLAPQGLFLSALGIQILSNRVVILQGVNPFSWPVIVKYQGMTVSRRFHETGVTFPTGQFIKVDNQPYLTRIALP